MSKTNFTPGPWGIERTDRNNWIGPLRPSGKAERIVVYNERGSEYIAEYRTEQDANAYLIAAAPDLYEALAWLRSLPPHHRADFWCSIREVPGAKEWIEGVDAALAKARGEEG